MRAVSTPEPPALQRRLGTADAVTIGLGSMIGAGVFVALAPAAAAAGSGLLVGLAVAAVVAYCNATSAARLAARYPQSGGTYVYGRERLGEFWGYLAGWIHRRQNGVLRGDGAHRRLLRLARTGTCGCGRNRRGVDGDQLRRRAQIRARHPGDRG